MKTTTVDLLSLEQQKAIAKLGVPAFVSRTSETRDDHSKPGLA